MRRIANKITAIFLSLLIIISFSKNEYFYAKNTLHTLKVNRHYRNPIDNTIEDSGGERSFAIGQGMVEGAIDSMGLLESIDNKKYITFRIKLMDYTKNHEFFYQKRGENKWHKIKAGISKRTQGKDGQMADIVINVPTEEVVVKGKMNVIPMGRDVIWFMTFNITKEGNETDMISRLSKAQNKKDDFSNGNGKKENIRKETNKYVRDKSIEKKIKSSEADSIGNIGEKEMNYLDKKAGADNKSIKADSQEDSGLVIGGEEKKVNNDSKDKADEKVISENNNSLSIKVFLLTFLLLITLTVAFILYRRKR